MRVVVHQCGFLGCRVGEASNPGPVQKVGVGSFTTHEPTWEGGVEMARPITEGRQEVHEESASQSDRHCECERGI